MLALRQHQVEETPEEMAARDEMLRRAFIDCLTAIEQRDLTEACLAAPRVVFVARNRTWPEDVPSGREHRAALSLEIKQLARAIDSFVPSRIHALSGIWAERIRKAGDLEALLFLAYLERYYPRICGFAMSPAASRESQEFHEFREKMEAFATDLERGSTPETMRRLVDLVDFSMKTWPEGDL